MHAWFVAEVNDLSKALGPGEDAGDSCFLVWSSYQEAAAWIEANCLEGKVFPWPCLISAGGTGSPVQDSVPPRKGLEYWVDWEIPGPLLVEDYPLISGGEAVYN